VCFHVLFLKSTFLIVSVRLDVGGTSTDVSRFAGRYETVYETTTAGVTIQASPLYYNMISVLPLTASLSLRKWISTPWLQAEAVVLHLSMDFSGQAPRVRELSLGQLAIGLFSSHYNILTDANALL